MATESERLNLDVSGEHARALHRVVRSMHDGHCPKCGYLAPAEWFYVEEDGSHECPKCDFTVERDEAIAALAAFSPYLQESVKIFERWAGRLS